MRLFGYVVSELRHQTRFVWLFIFNLALGLSGFIALDTFRYSLDQTLQAKSKAILGADFGLSARRPLTEAEKDLVRKQAQGSYEEVQMLETFSMLAKPEGSSRLVQVKAIASPYPYYGQIELSQGFAQPADFQKLYQGNHIWVYPELLRQLNIKIGDQLSLGTQSFTVIASVENDSAAGVSTSIAPRVYLGIEQLKKTELIQKGSLVWYSWLYKLPKLSSSQLEQLQKDVFEQIEDPQVKVFTHKGVSQQVGRLLEYLNTFLGLTSLVALFLGSLGSYFLFRSTLKNKIFQIGIWTALGLRRSRSMLLYIFQLSLLGSLGAVVSILLSFLILPLLTRVVRGFFLFDIQLQFHSSTFVLALFMGLFGSVLVCLPVLLQIRKSKARILFASDTYLQERTALGSALATLPALLCFWVLAMWLADSYLTGSLFLIMFLSSLLLLYLFLYLILRVLSRIRLRSHLSFRWALRNILRDQVSSYSCFLSIGLGAILLNLIPQIQLSLKAELETPQESRLPSFFLFDIQAEQLAPLQNLAQELEVPLVKVSPMVRARLLEVNGERFDKGQGREKNLTQEEEREMRFRNRGFNLSYQAQIDASESIVKGQAFSGPYNPQTDELAHISLERRFAKRLGLKIGDRLTFDIQSVPVSGQVINLRRVRWSSFLPNFFIQFQPGVLENAPKTFLAASGNIQLNQKDQFQDALVKALPNISIVDVSRLVDRLRAIMDQMAVALQLMALLCMISGLVVIFSIAQHQAQSKSWELALLKSLGASFGVIRRQFIWQFMLLAFFASCLGSLLSLGVSYIISIYLFESLWVFDAQTPILGAVFILILSALVTRWAISRSLKIKPAALFSK